MTPLLGGTSFALGLVLAMAQAILAHTCPGDSTDYLTECTREETIGQPCLRLVPGSGCCFAGLGVCSVGTCFVPASSTQTACNDGNQCTIDVCNTTPGSLDPICTYPLSPNGVACDLDEDRCTVDKCDHGTCRHFPPDVSCAQCQECNAATGQCQNVPNPAMRACDDGKDCTTGDICLNGRCSSTGIQPKDYVCTDGDACKPGRCNGSDGVCHNRESTLDLDHCQPDGDPSVSQARSGSPDVR